MAMMAMTTNNSSSVKAAAQDRRAWSIGSSIIIPNRGGSMPESPDLSCEQNRSTAAICFEISPFLIRYSPPPALACGELDGNHCDRVQLISCGADFVHTRDKKSTFHGLGLCFSDDEFDTGDVWETIQKALLSSFVDGSFGGLQPDAFW
jgi:hypothetical protein